MKRLISVLVFLITATSLCLGQADKTLLLRNPTLSKTHIVFEYAGDLWLVGREGGEASRLTSGIGTQSHPHFSPDGTLVSFTSDDDGNLDVYTLTAADGATKRLIY